MKKKIIAFTLTTGLLFSFCLNTRAQYVITEADKQFNLFNYSKSIDLYEQAFKRKKKLHVAQRLAEAYKNINNYKQAESWYAITVSMPGSTPENTLNYAKMLQSNSKYTDAKTQYLLCRGLNKDVSEKQYDIWIASCDSALNWMKHPKNFELANLKEINSPESDWGMVSRQGALIFTSDRKNSHFKSQDKFSFFKFDGAKLPDKFINSGTGNPYLKLYSVVPERDSVTLFPLITGTKYHVGAASFTADGNTMYFTMTRIPENLEGKQHTKTINVEIYSSSKQNGVWEEPVSFPYNNVEKYSLGDPFITTDGQSLYFAANMPGGKGGTDIYASLKSDAGIWGKPVNLAKVNTEGNERSPFFDANNNFYFSSDGRIGMGGLDVYRALRGGSGLGKIENMGYPFNSAGDDFSFYLNEKDDLAFLSSNRDGGFGNDDVYSVDRKSILTFMLVGKVYDKKLNRPLSGALVTVEKVNGNILKVETDKNGYFGFNLGADSEYKILAEKTNYSTDLQMVATRGLSSSSVIDRNLYLEAVELDKVIRLENIYYDFDKSGIRIMSKPELDKIVKLMKDNPTIWIELGSHTDSRGNDQYNQWLSQKRANSAAQYITNRGIDRNRIFAKGYGESELLNHCKNGIKCTDADHQLNRRTEFKIIKQ